MDALALPAAYSQLLGVGVLWIWVHCAGMCGPIVVGLDVARQRTGVGLGGGAARLLAYQVGKAIPYATLGMVAGLVGAGLKVWFSGGGGVFTVLFGLGVVGWGLGKGRSRDDGAAGLVTLGRRPQPTVYRRAFDVARLHLVGLAARGDLTSRVLLGAALGFLPCMITLWALGLAASTGSPLHGGMLMLLFVALTTPTLLFASALARPLARLPRRASALLSRAALVISGGVLVLAGLAALDVIPHAHLGFMAGGRHYLVMFW